MCPGGANCVANLCACPGAGESCTSNTCTCTADANCAAGQTCVNGRCGERVTALAVGEVQDSKKITQRKLVVGHGSIVSIIDLSSGAQTDINLASAYVPTGLQEAVSHISALAVHPQYGDIWAEVWGGVNRRRYLINIDSNDNSCRHGLTVQKMYQHSQNPSNPIPSDFGTTGDGHLVFMPDGMLLRYEAVVNMSPANWATFKVTK